MIPELLFGVGLASVTTMYGAICWFAPWLKEHSDEIEAALLPIVEVLGSMPHCPRLMTDEEITKMHVERTIELVREAREQRAREGRLRWGNY